VVNVYSLQRVHTAMSAVGGTRTNQNVGLGWEELSGAQPQRINIESMVDYLNSPTISGAILARGFLARVVVDQ